MNITEKDKARFFAKVNKEGPVPEHCPELGPCWTWQGGKSKNGYGQFSIGRKDWSTHRLSWVISNGEIPEGLYVCHRCDRKNCVRDSHLFTGTPKDNLQDAARKGRMSSGAKHSATLNPARGDRHPARSNPAHWKETHPLFYNLPAEKFTRGTAHHSARFSEADIISIRGDFANGVTRASLAKKYGVTWRAIFKIVSGLSWQHVTAYAQLSHRVKADAELPTVPKATQPGTSQPSH